MKGLKAPGSLPIIEVDPQKDKLKGSLGKRAVTTPVVKVQGSFVVQTKQVTNARKEVSEKRKEKLKATFDKLLNSSEPRDLHKLIQFLSDNAHVFKNDDQRSVEVRDKLLVYGQLTEGKSYDVVKLVFKLAQGEFLTVEDQDKVISGLLKSAAQHDATIKSIVAYFKNPEAGDFSKVLKDWLGQGVLTKDNLQYILKELITSIASDAVKTDSKTNKTSLKSVDHAAVRHLQKNLSLLLKEEVISWDDIKPCIEATQTTLTKAFVKNTKRHELFGTKLKLDGSFDDLRVLGAFFDLNSRGGGNEQSKVDLILEVVNHVAEDLQKEGYDKANKDVEAIKDPKKKEEKLKKLKAKVDLEVQLAEQNLFDNFLLAFKADLKLKRQEYTTDISQYIKEKDQNKHGLAVENTAELDLARKILEENPIEASNVRDIKVYVGNQALERQAYKNKSVWRQKIARALKALNNYFIRIGLASYPKDCKDLLSSLSEYADADQPLKRLAKITDTPKLYLLSYILAQKKLAAHDMVAIDGFSPEMILDELQDFLTTFPEEQAEFKRWMTEIKTNGLKTFLEGELGLNADQFKNFTGLDLEPNELNPLLDILNKLPKTEEPQPEASPTAEVQGPEDEDPEVEDPTDTN